MGGQGAKVAAGAVTLAAFGLLWWAAADGQDPPSDGGLPLTTDGLAVHFIDAGQGDATLLVAPDATVLVDTGRHTATDVVDYLRRRQIHAIDVVAITHPHADHIGQFPMVLDRFAVTEVWWSPSAHPTQTFERAVTALERSDAAFEEPAAGDVAEVGALRFEFVNPVAGGTGGDLHDDALAFRVRYGDVSFLFTGDAEEETEQQMVASHPERLAATVYQVGHHGSSTSTSQAFLEAVSPRMAVYSAGRDSQYGHPHPEVVDRLDRAGVDVYGTDHHGTVVVTTDGTDLEVHTEADQPALLPRATAGEGCPRPADVRAQGDPCVR